MICVLWLLMANQFHKIIKSSRMNSRFHIVYYLCLVFFNICSCRRWHLDLKAFIIVFISYVMYFKVFLPLRLPFNRVKFLLERMFMLVSEALLIDMTDFMSRWKESSSLHAHRFPFPHQFRCKMTMTDSKMLRTENKCCLLRKVTLTRTSSSDCPCQWRY